MSPILKIILLEFMPTSVGFFVELRHITATALQLHSHAAKELYNLYILLGFWQEFILKYR